MVVVGVGSITILLWVIGMAFARRLLRTQLALAEEEAKELESANERLVASSTELEAARERAEQEKVRAEKASNAKSEFLSNMSHELRTPLNSILGFAQLLEFGSKDPLSARQNRQVMQIRKSGEHLLSLIDDVLDLSKIEAGNIKLSIEPVPLKPLLEEVHDALSPLADKVGVAIALEIAEDAPVARADRTRLLQVLMNLSNNALKYNRVGGRLTLAAMGEGDALVRLLIADTAQGIPSDRQDEVFQPFNRLGAEDRAVEGTGIGLSITQRLVHLMGGEISFVSAPDVGTTFTVELPRWKGATGAKTPLLSNIVDLEQHRRGYTLLYVEDNPSNIELMQELVESLDDVRLLTAAHPSIGLALAEAHLPDVIVLDIDLPGMSGFGVLERLKAAPSTTSIPVIALTAAATPRDIQRGLGAGFTHYLTKPINVREFLAAIDSVLMEPRRARHRT
jgi:signal transduction histidine kinase/ActR/RegA family two-component response regulator